MASSCYFGAGFTHDLYVLLLIYFMFMEKSISRIIWTWLDHGIFLDFILPSLFNQLIRIIIVLRHFSDIFFIIMPKPGKFVKVDEDVSFRVPTRDDDEGGLNDTSVSEDRRISSIFHRFTESDPTESTESEPAGMELIEAGSSMNGQLGCAQSVGSTNGDFVLNSSTFVVTRPGQMTRWEKVTRPGQMTRCDEVTRPGETAWQAQTTLLEEADHLSHTVWPGQLAPRYGAGEREFSTGGSQHNAGRSDGLGVYADGRSGYDSRRFSIKPDKYDGKTGFEPWLAQFLEIAELSGWTEREKSYMFSLALVGNARAFYSGLSEEVKCSYLRKVHHFRLRFGQDMDSCTVLQELTSLRRQNGQIRKGAGRSGT